MNWKLTVTDGIGNLQLDHPDSEVNVLTSQNLHDLQTMLTEIAGRADIKALLITSAKNRIFIAGADIREIENIRSREDAFAKAEEGKKVFQQLENLKIPTICVINGACLGGGYELALACKYRVASFSDKIKIGLPEANLGILPGFGGSIRLPRLVGLLKGMPLILAGSMVSPEEALKKGMVDKLFPELTLIENSAQLAREMVAKGGLGQRRLHKDVVIRFLEDTKFGRKLIFQKARKDVLKRTQGRYPAPLEVIELLQKTYGMDSSEAYCLESEHFAKLGATEISKNLIKLFFLTEKYKKISWATPSPLPSPPRGRGESGGDSAVPPLPPGEGRGEGDVRKCGVIGAGVMGGGIAQLISNRKIPVRVKDINEKALSGALKEAASIYKAGVKRRKIRKHEMDLKMGFISVGLTNAGLKSCDVIIEAVIEDLGIKQKVFKEMSELTSPNVILASNTSSLPVTKMAEGCRHPERVVGLHFFNPVNRMPLVEVIRAAQTSQDTLERVIQFARKLGKTVIVVEDKPGFLVNRLLLPYLNEAAYLMQEGIGPQRLDTIAEKFGMPMGPVELVDQVGIDVGYKVAHVLEEAFGPRMKVAKILEDVKQKGLLGKKSGKGFYTYRGKEKSRNVEVPLPPQGKDISNEDLLKRMIYIMINEAARCLEEKVVDSAATVDIGMVMGTGFPPYRAGLLHYADSIGAANILKDLERFQKEVSSERFQPSNLLRSLAENNSRFYR